jgi:hypothetical protein
MSLRVKVFTVPGQVVHASTRRLVLQGADGVAFIADSQLSETENNAASFLDLRANLKDLGRSMSTMPLVIQFNKRDLPAVRTDTEIDDLAKRSKEPVYKATAVHGQGVLECFFGLLALSWKHLDVEHDLAHKARPSASARRAWAAARSPRHRRPPTHPARSPPSETRDERWRRGRQPEGPRA